MPAQVFYAFADLDYAQSNAFSNIWDQYLLKLNDYQLASLGSKTMFEYIFHVIHLLVNLPRGRTQIGFQTDQLQRVFMDPDGVIDISGNPNQFMENLFTPVAQAMDRIFNWRRELQITGSDQMQYAAVLYSACAVLCCAVLCCAVLCCAVLVPPCATLCCPVLCCALLPCAVLACAVLCCALLPCAVLACAVSSWVEHMTLLVLLVTLTYSNCRSDQFQH